MYKLIFLSFILFSMNTYSAQTEEIDSLLNELDIVVDSTLHYDQLKENSLNHLKELLLIDMSASNKFDVFQKLFDEYLDYNTDSAATYANKQLDFAKKLNSTEKIDQSQLNLAVTLIYTGIYKEAEEILRSIPVDNYPHLQLDYYSAFRRLYGDWFTYSSNSTERLVYAKGVDENRRKMIELSSPNSFEHVLALSDELNRFGNFRESLELTEKFFHSLTPNSHQRGSMAFNIALSYQGLNDTLNARKWMIISTINDLKASVKIYVFLREIAIEQFKQGNINRAYNYVRRSLEDGLFSNARLQTLKTLEMLPVIDKTYQEQNERSRKLLWIILVSTAIFTLLLLITVAFIYRQNNKLSRAKKDLDHAISQLNELNHELYQINVDQKKVNQILSESNRIKEEYIGQFMDQCSLYIDKMENYRHQLEQLSLAGRLEEMTRKIKSKDFIENELKGFYDNFDATFLHLFPNFIEEFNLLLTSPEPVRNDNTLSTELRIFALIRLGITDNVKISHFLRYSLSTIYNYKTKIRHKVKGDKDDFESMVMRIGLD